MSYVCDIKQYKNMEQVITNNKSKEFCIDKQRIAQYCKVLSHPARIAIIELLAEHKEIRTGNISDYLPIARTTVSVHLKELRNIGIIQGEIDGLKIHYCLNSERLKEIRFEINKLFERSISDYVCKCD
jgi:ArsR family transcriptional regulator, arsenate/arsenite/antimonite-responsive transcriptional repressor